MFRAFLFTALALCLPLTISLHEHELELFEKAPVSQVGGWDRIQDAPKDAELNLHIRLREERPDHVEQSILNIATPGHSQYGQFLTRDQLNEILSPSLQAVNDTLTWLDSNEISSYSLSECGGQIDLKLTVQQAARVFDTQFFIFINRFNNQTLIRADQYSLPRHLHNRIKTVLPIIRLPQMQALASNIVKIIDVDRLPSSLAFDPEFCNTKITPACIQGLYQLNNYTAPHNQGISLGISGFLNQSLRINDLHDFIAAAAPGVMQPFPEIVMTDKSALPDAANAPFLNTVEAASDVQISASLAPGIPMQFFSTPGLAAVIPDQDQPDAALAQNEPFLAHLKYIRSLPDDKIPSVLSISYGESEQSVPQKYAHDVCVEIGSLALRGVSVIVSSGDFGVGSACQKNDGTNTPTFEPMFPATCPYVTSVGGTYGVSPEKAAYFSSGGFSNYFTRYHHQDEAVEKFLTQNGRKNEGLFRRDGRAFPDISAQSLNFIIRDHGSNIAVSGTSTAAPVFAAMIANLNALRHSQGLPKLGLLNIWLYHNATSAFTDIVDGASTGCTGTSIYSGQKGQKIDGASWPAVDGWDPVTGLGTPIWPKLVELSNAFIEGGKLPGRYDPDSPEYGRRPTTSSAAPRASGQAWMA